MDPEKCSIRASGIYNEFTFIAKRQSLHMGSRRPIRSGSQFPAMDIKNLGTL